MAGSLPLLRGVEWGACLRGQFTLRLDGVILPTPGGGIAAGTTFPSPDPTPAPATESAHTDKNVKNDTNTRRL